MLLQVWNPDLSFDELDLGVSTFWVQIHGLPRNCVSEENALKIRSRLSKVEDIDVVKGFSKFARVRVDIDIENPFPAGFFYENEKEKVRWISFRYERLAGLCYKCGLLGHSSKNCKISKVETLTHEALGIIVQLYGPWIRAEANRKVIMVEDKPQRLSDEEGEEVIPEW
ncbi:Zinc finger, CCHC-type [Trema orientale]|uniref:Zinc finger, CCHC-type n=1 Tax=Trema orientale TaxID=63057 RepID=A0A2P5BMW2_TREOI|nr:Zinc finger, CCHC-type [Trema orientale]